MDIAGVWELKREERVGRGKAGRGWSGWRWISGGRVRIGLRMMVDGCHVISPLDFEGGC